MGKRISRNGRPLLTTLSGAILISLYGLPLRLLAVEPAQPDADAAAATAETADAGAEAQAPAADKASTEKLGEIVVTYRQSLVQALEAKREFTTQTDVIMAEDIGKFPDLNLAESLQRIPGISIARDAGEGRQISVRGLGPDFTRVRINGMEGLSTTGGTDSSGGNNRGRGFDFNVFASELFNRIEVHKTASAEVQEGSLGATVDLHTPRPFDFDRFTLVGSTQAGYNDLSKETNPRASALVSNTFFDGRFGALFSIAYSDRELVQEGASSVRWDNGPSSGGFNAASPFIQANGAGVFHPRIPRYGVLQHEQERLGMTGALQWQASDRTLLSLDMLYADFDAKRSENFLEAISFSRSGAAGKPQTIVRDGSIDARGNLVYGVFDDVDVRAESRYDELATTFKQTNLNIDHEFSDSFRMNALVGHSRSYFDNPIQTTITLDRANTDGYSWDYRGNDRLPLIDYGFDVRDPGNWNFANGLSEIRLRPNTTANLFTNQQLNFDWDVGSNFSLKGGLDFKAYKFATTESRRASEVSVPNLPAGTSLSDLTRLLVFGNNLGQPAGTPNTFLIPDLDRFAELFNIYGGQGTFSLSPSASGAIGNNRDVKERDRGGWVQGDFQTSTFGIPLRGNFGVRYVRTEQESTGFAIINSRPTLTTVEREYSDTLPSFNLAWDLSDDLLLRLGAAKVVSRPGLGNLTPGVSVSVSGGNRVVTGGDPYLDPFRAKTFDLGLEWYFAPESVLGAAFFYKDIDSFVQTSREIRPFNTSGLPASLLEGTGASPTDDFQFNIPTNTPGGKLRGVELSYQQPFTFLPGFWSHFGAIVNYTYVESKIQYVTSTGASSLKTDLTGLSKNAYNATLYFEKDAFTARVSTAFRNGYLTTVPGRNNNNIEGTKGTTNVDFMATYKLNDHVEFTVEAVNLTDEFNDQWVDATGDRSSVYDHTGREFFIGVRLRN
ncbi:TonB-dependent receptor [Tahibacter aquaticus]|uniref:TonB-dependent receptor n=1 Tax=Tahibacter aquaticus TaxID=520092 RepID=A0A4V3DLE9_9GAMM|nr:TonB-dependent receptor [Tahibacter aquaticus]TDR39101.1 TonB-dependent receptor [Tahibacter aquaticus]